MRNKILLISILMFVLGCKKQDYENTIAKSSSGQAFILKKSFIDSNIVQENIYDIDTLNGGGISKTYNSTRFLFDLTVDFYLIDEFEFLRNLMVPELFDYYAYVNDVNSDIRLNESIQNYSTTSQAGIKTFNNYSNLILMSPDADANSLYYGRTGFFLEQYLQSTHPNSKAEFGFFNYATNDISFLKDTAKMMAEFYAKSNNPQRSINAPTPQTTTTYFIDLIRKGIKRIKSNPNGSNQSKQLTILTYALVENESTDNEMIKSLITELKTEAITLNIISLLPLDFLQPIVFETNGFYCVDLPYLSNIANYITNHIEYENLVESKVFESSITIQNMHQLIKSELNYSLKFSVSSIFTTNDSLINIDSVLKKQKFHLRWGDNNLENLLPNDFELKPLIY